MGGNLPFIARTGPHPGVAAYGEVRPIPDIVLTGNYIKLESIGFPFTGFTQIFKVFFLYIEDKTNTHKE